MQTTGDKPHPWGMVKDYKHERGRLDDDDGQLNVVLASFLRLLDVFSLDYGGELLCMLTRFTYPLQPLRDTKRM